MPNTDNSQELAQLYAQRIKQNLRNALTQTRKVAHAAAILALREKRRLAGLAPATAGARPN